MNNTLALMMLFIFRVSAFLYGYESDQDECLSYEYEDALILPFNLENLREKSLEELYIPKAAETELILDTKKISIKGFSGAFNPSLIYTDQGLLLSFRYQPLPLTLPSVSYIYLVFLDEDLSLKSEPQLLNTRTYYTKVPSQSEDARLFYFQNELWVIYNDNVDSLGCSPEQRRDMYIAKIHCKDGSFFLSSPLKLKHQVKWHNILWQKNWVPFVWEDQLFMSYSIAPHEVLHVDLRTGICDPIFNNQHDLQWNYGTLRGGTPAIALENGFFSFFHSSKPMATPYSFGKVMWHYFMGAYTFSKSPPFELKMISKIPIMSKELYSSSAIGKKVVFPGGFVIKDDKIYIALGKNDCEIWIITLDKLKLEESLEPI